MDLCISTLVFRHGSESAEAVTSFLLSADGPMDRHSRLMVRVTFQYLSWMVLIRHYTKVSFDGIRMGPFTIDMMQKAKYSKRNMPIFDIKPPAQRKQYFRKLYSIALIMNRFNRIAEAIVKPKGEQNQSPSDKTVFVAAGITRVSRGQMNADDTAPMLMMGIEVSTERFGMLGERLHTAGYANPLAVKTRKRRTKSQVQGNGYVYCGCAKGKSRSSGTVSSCSTKHSSYFALHEHGFKGTSKHILLSIIQMNY